MQPRTRLVAKSALRGKEKEEEEKKGVLLSNMRRNRLLLSCNDSISRVHIRLASAKVISYSLFLKSGSSVCLNTLYPVK